ncbi:uncharacterized protein PADG_12190 [Paracoccidioides brasiliensis Pb18]|uniref:Uncharacterized protein n=1 Tax=Paracoccidioides brasiliensis (strain Pb18) TaxID=502780 RepID=A0A0A0HSY6_PARBD|nr:uncharacterized protein PADG_12190 [Paracoccidioides brasiliensis Pb18]KGM91732.1 hypothetical protein PADG_12190 [Paracoccidioides brasiliensis Pb18]
MADYQARFPTKEMADLFRTAPEEIWHSILQLVFAIGALYTLHTEDPRTAKGGDLTRSAFSSSAVGLKLIICVDSPSMEQLQVAAISVLYYLVSYHINRAWKLIRLVMICFGDTSALRLVNANTKEKENMD